MRIQEVFQLACKQARYGFTNSSPYISYGVYICTDKLHAAATVYFQ